MKLLFIRNGTGSWYTTVFTYYNPHFERFLLAVGTMVLLLARLVTFITYTPVMTSLPPIGTSYRSRVEEDEQAREGAGGQVAHLALRPRALLHGRQAGVLVGVHRRQEEPRARHAAQPRHVACRQGGGGAQIHGTSEAR